MVLGFYLKPHRVLLWAVVSVLGQRCLGVKSKWEVASKLGRLQYLRMLPQGEHIIAAWSSRSIGCSPNSKKLTQMGASEELLSYKNL